jgi:sucrose-6-phosphate hydrolase SacC (GH32 family)
MQSSPLPLTVLLIALFPASLLAQRPDLLVADFEGADYGSWKITGEAFGPGPARGTLPNQMPVDGFEGKGLVNSYFNGDRTTGTLTSPPFKIERRYIQFLIGGGKDTEKTSMHLLVDGRRVRTATGPNDRPGGSERLAPESWDVDNLAGQTASIEIIDQATGGWGHINVDQIVQTDRRLPQWQDNAERTFQIQKRFLNVPIKNGAAKRKVTMLVDGRVEVVNEMELADAAADWWAFMDVSAWKGRTVTLRVERLREDSGALSAIEPSDTLRASETDPYDEPSRGQFHFSSRRGWNNDPNGLVFCNGEYHLFYQHNPYGWNWGNMHWGHATSRDLVHWTEWGDVLAPDALGPMFSGSAVVDWKNTSGLGTDDKPPLVLIYTAAGNPTVQCLASSTDGRSFTKFSGNPVVRQITGGNRDPKVFWHRPTRKWVMTLYVETNKVHTIHFLTSPNLKEWTTTSRADGFFECPDFFELPVDGNAATKKWVLTAANSEYQIGTFDGQTFKPNTLRIKGHRGRGFYAAQTFSDVPEKDGRRIQIGWFQTPTPGMSFNQSMTIPLELNLRSTAEGLRMTWTPVKELEVLRKQSYRLDGINVSNVNPLVHIQSDLFEVRGEFEPEAGCEVIFNIRGATIAYDSGKQEIAVNGHRTHAPLLNGRQSVVIYCDRMGLEVFASDGLIYVPMPFIPKTADRGLSLQCKGGAVKFTTLRVHELKSAWAKP